MLRMHQPVTSCLRLTPSHALVALPPAAYKIPDWFLNRQKDVKDGRYSQVGGGRCTRWAGAGFASHAGRPWSGAAARTQPEKHACAACAAGAAVQHGAWIDAE